MPIRIPDIISSKGKGDAKRHREKQREVIKKNLPYIISEEPIITGKKGKIVKVPIKSIDIPHFRPGKAGKEGGIGQGEGKAGDVIGRKPPYGQGNAPGQEPGRDYIETEMEIEEIIELMLEDLGLPRLEEKNVKELIVDFGYKIRGLSHTGPWVLLDKKRSVIEGIKRFWALLNTLKQETGLPELHCFDALKKADGVFAEALLLLQKPDFSPEAKKVEAFPIFENDDLRFRKIEKDTREISRAVVVSMMDVSGSMDMEKKYLARAMLFWLVSFLRKLYEQVEVRFIVHHTEARIVEEEFFFRTGESGGTLCYKAYELARELIEKEYNPASWNVYVWHFSDGEDFDAFKTIGEIKKLFALNINMVGYGEIQPAKEFRQMFGGWTTLMKAMKETFPVLEVKDSGGTEMIVGKQDPLLGVLIEKREHILLALKQFLKRDRFKEIYRKEAI